MGLLDQVIGGVLGTSSGGGRGRSPIADALTELLLPQGGQGGGGVLGGLLGGGGSTGSGGGGIGGLGGLLDSFTRAGHGDVADSWVGSGANKPVAPHQLEEVIDNETIENLSRRTGLSRDELLRQLSQHLPNTIDRLTPDGPTTGTCRDEPLVSRGAANNRSL